MITGHRSMSVTNTRGITAPVARNWASASNQKRAKAIHDQAIRQSTKFAELKWSNLTGVDIIVPGNINKTTSGLYAPRNIFDNVTGLIPTYNVSYTPTFISTPQIAVATNKDCIIWRGISQQIEISGSVVVATVDNVPRDVRLQIFLDNVATGSENAPVVKVGRIDSLVPNTTLITIKQNIHVNPGQTIKLFIDRLDTEDDNINCKFYNASLSVKSLTIT